MTSVLREVLVAVLTKRHVVGLVLHEQAALRGRVRLMAGQAVHGYGLRVARVGHGHHRMLRNRVALVVLVHVDNCDLREVGSGQLNLAVEDREGVLSGNSLRLEFGAVAFEAEIVDAGCAQQVSVLSTVRLVTGGASLDECRLMRVSLLALFRLVRVAGKADLDRIGFGQAGLIRGMRIVAVGAVACGPRMLNRSLLDLVRFIRMASEAQLARAASRQDDLSVFRVLVTNLAALRFEGIVLEDLHQLRRGRRVRIMATEAIGRFERLVFVSFLKLRILHVMAVDAERRRVLGEVKVEFTLATLAGFVRYMAGVAAAVEGGVATAGLGDIEADVVAAQAKIVLAGVARSCFQQVVLVVGCVRAVTLDAISNRRSMNFSLELRGVMIGVTTKTESGSCGGC